SKNKQIFLMVIYLSSALLNIVLNVLFIPVASYNASAIITGVSEGFVLIFLIVKVLSLKKNFEI
ncbi:MAG: hypothetical protein M1372_01355, partial [Patescibacteria group bacterium]|nr:hypothetical protein [Patescibacteria group bacterium]